MPATQVQLPWGGNRNQVAFASRSTFSGPSPWPVSRGRSSLELGVAARFLADAVTSPDLDGVGGRFLADGGDVRSSEESYREDLARQLWARSAEWTGVGA